MKPDLIFQVFAFAALSALHCQGAENNFAEIIRKTEPLTPAQEQKTFHLPPGFEIQLVASEPEISKPMNMAFDAQGRLWITQSPEYPFPVLPIEQGGRDKIQILENFDAQGRAQKITTFAEGLNIPIGLYPYKNGVIAFSIPNIYFFQDTDGDGRSDRKELLLGRFGFERDTHGLTSHFRRGFDGWLYADHGFNNDSILTAKDGSSIKLNSGNTYRVRIDGSRIEQFTWGQVNPFGLMFDPWGDLWSSDCHSSPVYQLLRGARYPSFGKPHDGLGFAPNICAHTHDSTAIAGMLFYDAAEFPAEFRNNTFVGNVMTCRINRDSYIERGSTRIAKEEPDLLRSDDPWFRPVDLQLGPDGAIYVADFYNRIIGHYEVPLDNPGRDRERGRIWRIVYTGKNNSSDEPNGASAESLSEQLRLPTNVQGLVAELGNANITRRMLAMNELTDRIGTPAVKPVERMMRDKKSNAVQKSHGLWVLSRLGALESVTSGRSILFKAVSEPSPLVRAHALRVLSEMEQWNNFERDLVLGRADDQNPYVQRAAAYALGLHVSREAFLKLIEMRNRVPADDAQLVHTVRMALRNQLLDETILSGLSQALLSEVDSRSIADVAVAVPNSSAAAFLLQHIQKFPEKREKLSASLRHIARYADSGVEELAGFSENKFADDLDLQLALFKSVQEGAAQRGGKGEAPLRDWGARLVEKLFASVEEKASDWRNIPNKSSNPTSPWFLQNRSSGDGDKNSPFICSLPPNGESLTGTLRSKSFPIPTKLSFFMAGHDGFPDKPPQKKNFIQLRDAATKKVLAHTAPPRNNLAQPFSWDLSQFAGQKGFLEIVDGDTGAAYAWLAVGRFDPQVVPLPKDLPSQNHLNEQAAAEIAGSLRLKQFEPQLATLLSDTTAWSGARAAAAGALGAINPAPHLAAFGDLLNNHAAPEKLREKVAEVLGVANSGDARKLLLEALPDATRKLQAQIALVLASSAEGSQALIDSAEQGKVSGRLLQERAVRDRLTAEKDPGTLTRLEKLVSSLTPLSVEKQKLIDDRGLKFTSTSGDPDRGAKIFVQSCAACHQLDKEGALVGPQLDGVGGRGADRLIEDILDPNRNVDRAFLSTIIVSNDGDVQSGLFRREEGEMIVLADSTGKEISIPKAAIKEKRESESSLMPDNFSDVIPLEEFNDLIAFLLSKGTKAGGEK